MMLGILGGRVYDPQHGKDGEVGDIWVKDGRVVAAAEVDRGRAEVVDAAGLVVMPGGVDIHAHIVGGEVNAGRKMRPEDHRGHERARSGTMRAGAGGTVPSTYATGYLYSELGYTTVMQASAAPLVVRHTHEELEDTPNLDNGAFIVMGNNHFVMKAIADKQPERARDYVAWLLGASQGYAIKVVNPGGVENWKWGRNVAELDDEVIGYGVTPRQIVQTLAGIADDLGLPHPVHIHGINLGRHTSARTSIEMIEALDGHRVHLCHLQFLSYGPGPGHVHRSEAAAVAAAVNARPLVTVDVGQVIFGSATTMTCDGPLQHRLHVTTGGRWINDDVESESGGGIVPITYKASNPINATMWLTGLELFLLIDDPWRVYLTTDHPNAGCFTSYPQVIRLLMDRGYRREMFDKLHPRARKGALLPELDREYSLGEIAIITRAGPARTLGLAAKGHLGVGADADITVYEEHDDKEAMFARPRYVYKGGVLVARDGAAVADVAGRTFSVAPPYDPAIETDLRTFFKEAYTVSFDNYSVLAGGAHTEQVACG
ncbi:MAG: formylmethanofuran dehydrogenase subunit A [Thermoleophilia bacterium]